MKARVNRSLVHRTIQRVRIMWHTIRHRHNHRTLGRAAIAGHLTYYGLVFVESHGLYGKAALFCGVILVIEAVLGDHRDEG